MDRDKILLTPGPLTTTLRTKLAMLKDWGSWDADFNAVTASVRKSLLAIVHGSESHVLVPLQGSGTFSVEAAVGGDAANQKLSIARAEAVKNFLVKAGIEKNRVYTEGKGEKSPVADNKTNEGRAKNRRVEVEVVGTRTRR